VNSIGSQATIFGKLHLSGGRLKALVNKSLSFFGLELKRKDKSALDVQRLLCRRPQPVILDVGANIGQTATEYRRLFPDSKLYAFEPFPECFISLNKTFSGDCNTIPVNMALSDYSGEALLFSNAASVTNPLLETVDDAERIWGEAIRPKNSISVRVVTLNEFCMANSIDYIDILKIDTQGTELPILRGASDLLKRNAVDLIYFELIVVPTYKDQTRIDECFNHLYRLGYRLFDVYNLRRKNNRLLQMDVLFTWREETTRRGFRRTTPKETREIRGLGAKTPYSLGIDR
jgi:FkbM family methyltransferase